VAQNPPAPAAGATATDDEAQSPGALQLLPCHRKRLVAWGLSPGSRETALQVVESTQPKKEFDLGTAQTGTGDLSVSDPQRGHERDTESGACVKARTSARASTTEEPGAGKPHAGICAGGAG